MPKKDELAKIRKQSVQARAREDEPFGVSLLLWLGASGDIISPWWSKQRDRQLRTFWRQVDYISGTVYTMESRLKTVPFKILPRDLSVKTHMKQADDFTRILMEQSEFGRGWDEFYSPWVEDLICLAGCTRVALGGERRGKTKSISSIIRDYDPGPIISLHPDGYFVEKEITEWRKTPLGDRRWWWISTQNVSGHSQKLRGGLFLTEDHPLLTDVGWQLARDITPGMKVATGDPEPSPEQAEILTGMILGDASIGIVRKRARLRMTHAADQEPWLKFKMQVLSGFSWTGYNRHTPKLFNGYQGQDFIGVNSRATMGLIDWRKTWYPKGKKVVNREYVERYFSPRMMAAWYCDDGSLVNSFTRAGNETSPHMMLCTHGFTFSDVEWLVGFLSGKGIPCQLKRHKNNGKIYPIIYVTCEGTRKLVEYIGPYVPPSMRHKLPVFAPPYDPSTWEINPARSYFDTVVESKPRSYYSGGKETKTTYHIGIEETRTFIAAGLVSHNTQDNGAFAEVIGAGKPDGPIRGMAMGLSHLDSWRCQRTSSMKFPVIYQDTDGKRYKMHYTRVIFTSQMPSPAAEMHRVGMCAISRCINVAQTLLDQLVYKQEKLGSRPHRGLLVTQGGIGPEHVKTAFEMAEEAMDSQLLRRYSKTVVIGSTKAPAGAIQKVDLTSLPDGFDERDSLTLGMAAIALAFGMDPRELFPALTTGATKAEALISHIKQRGKGIGDILQTTERLIENKFLPGHLQMEFDFQDDEQDKQVAEIKGVRSTYHVNEFVAGIVDARTVREQMLHDGDLTQPQFERMELEDGRLEDGTTVLSLFFDLDYSPMLDLGVEAPLDTKINDTALMLDAISAQRDVLLGDIVKANQKQKKMVQQALAALDELELAYGGRSTELTKPKPPKPEEIVGEVSDIEITEDEFVDEDLEVKRSWLGRILRKNKQDEIIQDAALAIKEAAEKIGSDGR